MAKGKEGAGDKWKNVDDEFGTFGKRDNFKGPLPNENQATVKRSSYI